MCCVTGSDGSFGERLGERFCERSCVRLGESTVG